MFGFTCLVQHNEQCHIYCTYFKDIIILSEAEICIDICRLEITVYNKTCGMG